MTRVGSFHMTILVAPMRMTKPGAMRPLAFPEAAAEMEARGAFRDREGWYAEVRLGDSTLQVSKLDGETGWTIDANFHRGLPMFVNGYGARYLRTMVLRDELAAELDGAVR